MAAKTEPPGSKETAGSSSQLEASCLQLLLEALYLRLEVEAFVLATEACASEWESTSKHLHGLYHLTENYYIINSETIMDVNNYIPFSIIKSQAIDVM